MRTPIIPKIRALLRQHPDGLTAAAVADIMGKNRETVRSSLYRMPDAYIDRWEEAGHKTWASVWCVVEVPEHCPHPKGKYENAKRKN